MADQQKVLDVPQYSAFSQEVDRLLWFALRVKPRHERAVSHHLERAGIEPFVPFYRSKRRWSDRIKELELPLFPGYAFARFNLLNRVTVLRVPGVQHIVGSKKDPVPVTEAEISAIKQMVASGLPVEPWPYVRVGDWVRIVRGPLRELEGFLIQERGGCRVIVSVHLLQRSVAAEVDRLDLVLVRRREATPAGRSITLGTRLSPAPLRC